MRRPRPLREPTPLNTTPESNEIAAKCANADDPLGPRAEKPLGAPIRSHDEIASENVLSSSKAAELVEANEQLVLAALRAHGDAEAAADAFQQL